MSGDADSGSGLRLKPLQVAGFPLTIDLEDGKLTLGRAEDNDVCLPGDVFPSVSQHHVRLDLGADGITVQDLGSRNGTLVNGKRIEKAKLAAGDIIQLGTIGPRFVAVATAPLSETMFVDPEHVGLARERDRKLSESRVYDIKEALGVPEHGVEELVRRRTRRTQTTSVVLAVLVLTAAVLWGRHIFEQGAREQRAENEGNLAQVREDYEAKLRELAGENQRLASAIDGMADQELERSIEMMQFRKDVDGERQRIEGERDELQKRLVSLEASGDVSMELLAGLRTEIEQARTSLDLLDPVNLEQTRLTEVTRVRASIVLIESKMMLKNSETGKLLHVAEHFGAEVPNFEDLGRPWTVESTGSGFCVSPEGWILSNAHVVLPPDTNPLLLAALDLPIEPVMELAAVFSGESRRHPVEVVRVANGIGEDLALVKIEPFEGMPYLDDFDLDAPALEPGSDVFLFGFPLGNFAIQQGETVIASTFRGIVSRVVDDLLQVDAGVHPGNSGGPVTDINGHVIGVVFSVQALPDQSAVYTIGYAIPIAAAAKVWPPPDDWGE